MSVMKTRFCVKTDDVSTLLGHLDVNVTLDTDMSRTQTSVKVLCKELTSEKYAYMNIVGTTALWRLHLLWEILDLPPFHNNSQLQLDGN